MERPSALQRIDWPLWRRLIGLFVAWRLILWAFLAIGVAMAHERRWHATKGYQAFPDAPLLDAFFRWDSAWYDRIVTHGYGITGPMSNVVFFPLYPFLVRWTGYVVGDYRIAGLLISNVCTLGALYYLYRIGEKLVQPDDCERAVILVLCYPASVFLGAFYTEGLFLLTVTASFHAYLDKRWVTASVWGALASATRSSGVLLLAAYAVGLAVKAYKRELQWSWRLLSLALIPSGLAAFMVLLHVEVGNALAFVDYQSGWGRGFTWPWEPIVKGLSRPFGPGPHSDKTVQFFLDALISLAYLVAAIPIWRRLGPAMATFVALSVVMALTSGQVTSINRYVLVLFPMQLWLATWLRDRNAERLFIGASSMLFGFYSVRFASWYWAG